MVDKDIFPVSRMCASRMIVYETNVIRITCDLWGRWSVYFKALKQQSELENTRKAISMIELEIEIWERANEV